MIAVDEKFLDLPSVGRTVIRKDVVPGVRHVLQLTDEPVVGHVANDHHGIDLLVAEERERLAKDLRRGPIRNVNVAQDTEGEVGTFRSTLGQRTTRKGQRLSPHKKRTTGKVNLHGLAPRSHQ